MFVFELVDICVVLWSVEFAGNFSVVSLVYNCFNLIQNEEALGWFML